MLRNLLLLVFLASGVFAQTAPSPSLEELEVFEGFWNCNGTAFASAFGPERPIRATIRVEWVLNDFWLNSEYVERRTGKNPAPAAGHVHWGYDEKTQKLTGYGVNNFGGHIKVESDGFTGDTIVWSGTMNVGLASFPTRDTFIRKSSREIEHMTEADIGGQFVTLNRETCKKTN